MKKFISMGCLIASILGQTGCFWGTRDYGDFPKMDSVKSPTVPQDEAPPWPEPIKSKNNQIKDTSVKDEKTEDNTTENKTKSQQ